MFNSNFDLEIAGLRLEVSIISSVKEFQLSHFGHLPSQRRDSYPQLEQMYFILVLDIENFIAQGRNVAKINLAVLRLSV